MLFKIKKLKNIINNNGTLVPIYLDQIKNFKVKRFVEYLLAILLIVTAIIIVID